MKLPRIEIHFNFILFDEILTIIYQIIEDSFIQLVEASTRLIIVPRVNKSLIG